MQNCVWANCAPASTFACKLVGCHPGGGSIGLSALPRKKSARPPILTRRQFAHVAKASRGGKKPPRIEIKYRLGIRLIAGTRIVATQHQQVPYARRSGAEQIALYRDAVAVAA